MSEDIVPAFSVRVTLPGEKNPTSIDVSDRVVSFAFEDSAKLLDKVTLGLDNFDLSQFDDERFKHDNLMEVSYGYVGNQTDLRICSINSLRGGFPVLQVEAIGHALKMDTETKSRRFDNMTRSAVVKKIAEEHGFGTDAVIEDTKVVYPSITQAAKTDGAFIRWLATKEGFEFFVDKGGLHFHRRDLTQTPIRDVMWYGGRPGDTLKALNYEQDHKLRQGKKTAKGRDPMAKTPIKAVASNTDTPRASLGTNMSIITKSEVVSETGALTPKFTVVKEVTGPTSERQAESAKRQADGDYLSQQHKAIKLHATLVGDPTIRARQILLVQGIGKRLSGRWYIVKAVHKIDSSGYATILEMERDTHQGYGDAKRDIKSKGTPNTKTPAAAGALIKTESVNKDGSTETHWKAS